MNSQNSAVRLEGVLPLPLNLIMLLQEGFLKPWTPRGARLTRRCFYYSASWQMARESLPGLRGRELVQWWDEDHDVLDVSAQQTSEEHDALINPEIDPSPRGRLDGFVETFVCGKPRHRLIRKVGFGMDPPFQRMRHPFSAVVEMRTQATRTFGYFVRRGVYVAYRLDTADSTHADPRLYFRYGGDVVRLLTNMVPTDKDVTSDVENLIGD